MREIPSLTDKERIRELEINIETLLLRCEKNEKKIRNITARLERLERRLKHFLWFFKSWKHFFCLVVILCASYSLMDIFVDTTKVQRWFFQEFIPWAQLRKLD
jgi:hypothetical protein